MLLKCKIFEVGSSIVLPDETAAVVNASTAIPAIDAPESMSEGVAPDDAGAQDESKDENRDVALVTLGGGQRYEGLGVLYRAVREGSDEICVDPGVSTMCEEEGIDKIVGGTKGE